MRFLVIQKHANVSNKKINGYRSITKILFTILFNKNTSMISILKKEWPGKFLPQKIKLYGWLII